MPDLINEVISPIAFKQLDDAIIKLADCKTAVTDLAAEAKKITFDFKIPKDLSALTDLINKANAATAAMTNAQTNLNQATSNYNTLSAQYTQQIQKGADALAQQRLELSYVDSQLKLLIKDIQDGNGSIDANNQKLAMWTRRQQELKVEIAATTQALKSEIKENYAAADSMDGMSQRLGQLREQYRALSAAERASPIGQQMQTDIRALDSEVKTLDASIGNSQRNVGNYGSAWGKFSGILDRMGLRLIAQVAVFGAIMDAFKEIGDAYKEWSDRVNYQNVAMGEVAKKSANAFGQEAAALQAMKDRFFDVTTTMSDKQEIVDELNSKYENQIGKLHGVADAEKFFVEKSAAFIKALDLRAQAEAALSVITDQYKKQLEATANPESTLSAFNKIGAGAKALATTLGGLSRLGDKNFFEEYEWEKLTRGAGKADRTIQDTSTTIDYLLKQYTQLQNEANKIDKANGFKTDEHGKKLPKGPKPTDFTKETLKAERDLTKEIYAELAKRALIEGAYQKAIADEESNSLADRVTAYRKYASLVLEAKRLVLDGEYHENEQSLAKIASIEKIAADKRTKEQKDLLLTKEVLLQKQKTLVAQNELDNRQSEAETQKAITKIYEDEVKYRLTALQKIKTNNDLLMQDELDALRQRYSTGLMGEEVYQEKVKQIKEKYAIENDQQQIAHLKTTIAGLTALGVDVAAVNKALADAEDKLRQDQAAKDDEALSKKAEGWKKIKELTIQLAGEIASAYIASQDAQFEYQQRTLDKQGTQMQLHYEQERRAIEASAGYQADKAAKLQDLNAQQAADENKLEQQKKQLAITKAKFDRDASIANIIAHTAEAIAATLPLYADPVTVPFAIAQDVLIAAIGAAQIAKASSAPLPAYKLGTMGHIGGPFIAGDGHEPEYIKAPGKEGYWSNPVSTIYSEAAGTKVIPLSKMVKHLSSGLYSSNATTHNNYQQAITGNDSAIFEAVGKQLSGKLDELGEGLAYVIGKSKPVINITTDSPKTSINRF